MNSILQYFRLGVMELFAVLMPGAALCIVLSQSDAIKDGFLGLLPHTGYDWQGGVAFFVASYFMGYVTYVLGGKMDRPVDKYWILPHKTDLVYRIIPLKVKEIGFDKPESLNNYQWALTRLLMDQPELYADVERYQATAKFFRSMVVVWFVALCLFLFSSKFSMLIPVGLLLLLSVYLYYERRMKSLEIAYKRIITMLGAPTPYPEDVDDLIGLNLRIGKAEKDKDYEFLNAVLADNLVFRRASGAVVDKYNYLKELSGKIYEKLEVQVEEPVYSADKKSAFVNLKVIAQMQGEEQAANYRNERLFHLDQQGKWKMVAWMNHKE